MARRRVEKPLESTTTSHALSRVLLVLLALVAFANGLPNAFTYDDLDIVRDNPRLGDPAQVSQLVTVGYWGETSDVYRPVVLLSFAVQGWVHGLSAPLLRGVNVVLHGLVVLLLFEWLLSLGMDRRLCIVASALFAVMPIHVEAVTSIVGRAELMAAALSLLSALAYLRAARVAERRGTWATLAVGAFGLALFAKESAAALPGVIILAELFWPATPTGAPRERWKRIVVVAAAGVAVLAVALWIRHLVLGGALRSPTALPTELTNPLSSLPPGLRILNASNYLWLYAAKCVVPFRLSADYSAWALRPIRALADPVVWIGSIGWLAVLVAALRWRRTFPQIGLGLLFFPVAFLPTSNLVFPIGTVFAERLAYFPSAGIAVLAGFVLLLAGRHVFRTTEPGPRGLFLPALLVALLIPMTMRRNRDWRDDRSLYQAIVREQPGAARGRYLLGFDAYRRGDLPAAELELRAAVAIHRPFPNAWNVLGDVLWRQRKFAEALAAQETAVALAPRRPDSLYYLALWNAQLGREDQARSLLRRGIALFPADESFRRGLQELDSPR
ncbi:MAG: tetratricopeptide repeat protein [Holophagales bacterium]|nr:tetratricopeptide repeat protein [Holophagales bacterium]